MTRGVPEYITKAVWAWRASAEDFVHAVYRRERTPYMIAKVDYVTGCGLVLTVDMVPARSRLYGVVTCLRCAVAEINPAVVRED